MTSTGTEEPIRPRHDEHTMERTRFEAQPGAIEVRQEEDDPEGLFRIRMPVSSTAEARDGKAFDRDRLEGYRQQIEAGDIGVFLDHGRSPLGDSRYSALGKVGYWTAPDLRERDEATDLMAEAVIADPATMDGDLSDTQIREVLAWLKHQAQIGIPLASSVGWSDDTGDRDVPGDSDLLEISIVGIPSDARTSTADASDETAMARAVSAASDGFDMATFARALRQAEGVDTVQVPEYDEADNPSGGWDGHDLEDFEEVLNDPTPQDPEVYNKFAVSDTGFPPAEDADFDTLSYPLVDVDGTLVFAALSDAMDALPQGVSDEEAEAVTEVIVELKAAEFPDEELPGADDESDGENSTDTNMTENDNPEGENSGDDPEETHEDTPEWAKTLIEHQERQTELLEDMADGRQDDEDGDGEDGDDEEDGEDGDDEDDDMNENSSDEEPESRMVEIEGETMSIEDAREFVENKREKYDDVDGDNLESGTKNRADDDAAADSDGDNDDEPSGRWGIAGRMD
jgi:hypothetical protein